MIGFFRQLVEYQRLFLLYARWRLLALYFLIATSSFVEAIGIVAVLPLLNAATGDSNATGFSRTVADALDALGIAPTVPNMLLLIVAIFALRGFLIYLYTYTSAKITVTVRREVQASLTRQFCAMDYSYYTLHPAGWFNNIIVNETNRFISSLRAFARVSVSVINALIFLPLVMALRLELTIVVFLLGGLILTMLRGPIQKTAAKSHEQSKNAGRLNVEFIQLIHSFVYLKSTAAIDRVGEHVVAWIDRIADNELHIRRISAIFAAIKEPIAVVVLAVFIYIEVVLIGGSLAEILIVALLVYRALIQLVSLAPEVQNFNETIGGVSAVRSVAHELRQSREPDGAETVTDLDGDIAFRGVSFRYGSKAILKNIDVLIRPNETIGIVGASGAGKTTFFHLLTGLLEPSRGTITIGSMPYRKLSKRSMRSHIGYVTQDPVIFNDTVIANISMWACETIDKACMSKVRSAARTAKCDGFIQAMKKGYRTVLGERGVNLSGGERQRVAIARELFKQPRLLIFDEAASALDADSERYVQESIDDMRGRRTMVIITHRLSSVRNCDRIYVFRAGRVVEHGSFSKLYQRKKSYFRYLCDQQEVSV